MLPSDIKKKMGGKLFSWLATVYNLGMIYIVGTKNMLGKG